MKITVELTERSTLSDFANKNGLSLKVRERNSINLPRFYAAFEGAETKSGSILSRDYGDGNTVDEAINNYGKIISSKLLVLHAGYPKKRREIRVPILV